MGLLATLFYFFPDLSPDKSGRACLPPPGALRPARHARPD